MSNVDIPIILDCQCFFEGSWINNSIFVLVSNHENPPVRGGWNNWFMRQFFSFLTPHLIFLSLNFWKCYVSDLNLIIPNFMSRSCCKDYEFCFEEIGISKVDIFSIQNSLIWHLPWVSFFCLDFQKTVKSNRWQLGRPLMVGR